MSAVDVLAVMDSASDAFHGYSKTAKALLDARAAVAELIEAASAVLGDTPPAGEPGHVDFGVAIKQLRTALARVGGAK